MFVITKNKTKVTGIKEERKRLSQTQPSTGHRLTWPEPPLCRGTGPGRGPGSLCSAQWVSSESGLHKGSGSWHRLLPLPDAAPPLGWGPERTRKAWPDWAGHGALSSLRTPHPVQMHSFNLCLHTVPSSQGESSRIAPYTFIYVLDAETETQRGSGSCQNHTASSRLGS